MSTIKLISEVFKSVYGVFKRCELNMLKMASIEGPRFEELKLFVASCNIKECYMPILLTFLSLSLLGTINASISQGSWVRLVQQ